MDAITVSTPHSSHIAFVHELYQGCAPASMALTNGVMAVQLPVHTASSGDVARRTIIPFWESAGYESGLATNLPQFAPSTAWLPDVYGLFRGPVHRGFIG